MPPTMRSRVLAVLAIATVLTSALGVRTAQAQDSAARGSSSVSTQVAAATDRAATARSVAGSRHRAKRYVVRLAHAAARHPRPAAGRHAAARARHHLPRPWRAATTVSAVRHRYVTVTVADRSRCVHWPPGGRARIGAGTCARGGGPAGNHGTRPGGGSGGATLFGFFPGNESSDPNATYSVRSSFATISSSLGTPGVARVFFSGLPPATFAGSTADLGVPVVVSFKADPVGVAAGSYDAQVRTFFASVPAGQMVWWSYYHEPEDNIERGEFTAAQYRAAWTHLEQVVPIRDTLRPTLILMRWSLQVPGRHVADYVTPGLAVLAWDAYLQQWSPTAAIAFDPAKRVSDSFGLGFAVAETSIDNAMTSPPNRSVAVQDVVDRARADGAEFVTWFETNKSDGDWRLTPYAAATTLWDQLT